MKKNGLKGTGRQCVVYYFNCREGRGSSTQMREEIRDSNNEHGSRGIMICNLQ